MDWIDKTQAEFPKMIKKSIFLAGPSFRGSKEKGPGWRQKAREYLESKGYDGTVFVPEPFTNLPYEQSTEWEDKYLQAADVIVFWVPRDLEELPGFTTNVEFGEWMRSNKVVLGYPNGAEKMRYLQYKADKYHIPVGNTLEETLDKALALLGVGAARVGAEGTVPLNIWETDSFRQWYSNLKKAGNKLVDAKVLWNFVMPKARVMFAWVVHADVWIKAENRVKSNEFVFARSDIAVVFAYHKKGPDVLDTEVVLIKEFRTPVSNADGYVHELPGGSSLKPNKNPLEVAQSELKEETGVGLDIKGFKKEESRQLAATLSAHKAHLFSRELTDLEMEAVWAQKDKVHGVIEDTEVTYVSVKTVREILKEDLVDWSMIGMMMSVLRGQR